MHLLKIRKYKNNMEIGVEYINLKNLTKLVLNEDILIETDKEKIFLNKILEENKIYSYEEKKEIIKEIILFIKNKRFILDLNQIINKIKEKYNNQN